MSPAPEVHRTIDALYDAWSAAFRRGDVDAIVEMLTADYLLWAAGLPAMVGREPLRPILERTFAAGEVTSSFDLEERLTDGGLAIDRGWDVQAVRLRATGELRTARQRAVLVLRRDDLGAWRFARGFRMPGPPP